MKLIKLVLFKDKNNKINRSLFLFEGLKYFVPCLFTFFNAIFGFLSILKSFENNYKIASLFIICAALMDMMDGKLARILGSSSYFGTELDSLSDTISFCLAPVVLLYCWIKDKYIDSEFILIVILSFYLCAGIARLAKFNIKSVSNNVLNYNFIGLPTTGAALFVSIIIAFYDDLALYSDFYINTIIISIFFISLLMISKIEFKSIKNINFFSFSFLLFVLINIIFIYFFNSIFILLQLIVYIFSNIYNYFIKHKVY